MASKSKKENEFEQNPDMVIKRSLSDMMHESMMPYAEYIIMERALPRVEDGLKPVQRRILYTMMELGLTPDKPHRKSARIVGDAMGKYHPHGDSSVYGAMVRMAQDYNMRAPLVDGHGNFGSIDGDSPAAMRYTEARMTNEAMEMLRDIKKDTVDFMLNFDDTLKEPRVLPSRFPNLLVNGSSGIAIGLATNIPPHNMNEVIDAVVAQMKTPDISLNELMDIIPAPDFPTGGSIVGKEQLKQAYKTGRGKISVRAKVEVEASTAGKKNLVITELPYQVNKASMLEKILRLSEQKKGILTGISDIRDESDRTGMRAVIEIKKDADAEIILNYLYKYSDLQTTFGINMVAIAEGKPQQLGLKKVLDYYIKHQKDVVTRRTQYDLDKAKAREHILQGLMIAVDNIDDVIAIIRTSENPKIARQRLMQAFELTEIQAQAILDMRLQRLTDLEVVNLRKEYEELLKLIAKLERILNSDRVLINLIIKEMNQIKEKYGNNRRTKILSDSKIEPVSNDDFIVVEETLIVLTRNQDIKRVSTKSLNRSTKDIEAIDVRERDYIQAILPTMTNHRLLFFTDNGNCYSISCSAIPETKWRERGEQVANIVNGFNRQERIIGLFAINTFDHRMVQFYTQKGMVKRTNLVDYQAQKTKIAACGLKSGDTIINVDIINGSEEIFLATKQGMSIRFESDAITPTGRTARGVIGIKLMGDDEVRVAQAVNPGDEVIVFTDRGIGKRTRLTDYPKQGRAGKGCKTITFFKNQSNGTEITHGLVVDYPFDFVVTQKDGTMTNLNTKNIPLQEREGRGKALVMAIMDNIIENVYRQYQEIDVLNALDTFNL